MIFTQLSMEMTSAEQWHFSF